MEDLKMEALKMETLKTENFNMKPSIDNGEIAMTPLPEDLEMTAATTTHTSSEALPTTTSRTAMAGALLSHANRFNSGVPLERRVKFKDGKWFIGDKEANLNDDYYADPLTITTQWEIFQNDKKSPDRIVAAVGEILPPREALGHHDRGKWELGVDGHPKDPCQETHYIDLIRRRDGERLAYGTSTYGGKVAISELARAGSVRPEEVAIITLESNEYKNKKFGRMVQTPVLDARRWVHASVIKSKQPIDDKKQIEAPKANTSLHAGVDPDDDIPF